MQRLKEHAETTVLQELRVTPELKDRLMHRIRVEEKKRQTARGPWVGRAAVATVAACALVAVGLGVEMPVAPQAKEVEEKPAAAQVPPPFVPPAPAVANLTGEVLTVRVSDASATKLTLKTDGFTLDTATVANGPAIAGVEAEPGRKIVLNAEYQLQVNDASSAMQRLQEVAHTTGGYTVDAALNSGEDGSWAGRVTLRIPSARYSSAIAEVHQVGAVQQQRQWTQDVTERYMDLEARIKIQTEYEQQLRDLASKATTFEDWMKLTGQINETRAKIEAMQGSLKLLANQVEYSTINVTVRQPAPGKAAEPKPEAAKGLGAQMGWAFGESLRLLGNLGRALLVGVAASLPFLLPVALVCILGYVSVKRRFKQ